MYRNVYGNLTVFLNIKLTFNEFVSSPTKYIIHIVDWVLARLAWALLSVQEDVGSSALKRIILLHMSWRETIVILSIMPKRVRYDQNLQ